ncbi:MAG TPA: hypothetical protein VL990_12365 [Acidobacteriaceae bacterium]|nr:hypothetical protein [Acidobacteriaceae bacterium]
MKRPLGITFVAVLEFAAAAIAGVVGYSLFFPGTRLDRMWDFNVPAQAAFAANAHSAATILLLLGTLATAAGVGLLTRQVWAWLLSLAIFSVNALGVVASVLVTRDWARSLAGILIDALFLYLLLRARSRAFFLERR